MMMRKQRKHTRYSILAYYSFLILISSLFLSFSVISLYVGPEYLDTLEFPIGGRYSRATSLLVFADKLTLPVLAVTFRLIR